MINKIKNFCSFFDDYQDCYTLLGGAACTIWYMNHQPAFRPTMDVDVVLILEAINPAFMARFHEYMERYGYAGEAIGVDEAQRPRMYRLQTSHPEVPMQIEILSRRDDVLLLPPHQHRAPLKIEDKYTNLSCILMDDVYYHFLRQQVTHLESIPLPSKAALIALKIKAYLNIREMRESATEEELKNHKVPNEDEMNKHRNDVFFLLMDILPGKDTISVPAAITNDARLFASVIHESNSWMSISQSLTERRKQEKQAIRSLSLEPMLDILRNLFHVND